LYDSGLVPLLKPDTHLLLIYSHLDLS